MTLSEEASARIPRSPRRLCLSVQRNRRDPGCPVSPRSKVTPSTETCKYFETFGSRAPVERATTAEAPAARPATFQKRFLTNPPGTSDARRICLVFIYLLTFIITIMVRLLKFITSLGLWHDLTDYAVAIVASREKTCRRSRWSNDRLPRRAFLRRCQRYSPRPAGPLVSGAYVAKSSLVGTVVERSTDSSARDRSPSGPAARGRYLYRSFGTCTRIYTSNGCVLRVAADTPASGVAWIGRGSSRCPSRAHLAVW